MKESLGIQQEQRLTQRLSPRQVLHARVLEMTAPELEEELHRQLDDNPALEVQYNDEEPASEEYSEEAKEIDKDDDPADYYQASNSADGWDYLFHRSADMPDLYQSLQAQAGLLDLPEPIADALDYLIGNIDENGYMTRTIASLSEDYAINTGKDARIEDMRHAFEILRGFDPVGVGAVDLRDCLLLQLKRMSLNTPEAKLAYEIVNDYFDLLSKKHYERLVSSLNLRKAEDLQPAMDVIRSLNPKPGSALEVNASLQRQGHISPDVELESDDDGHFTVSIINRLPQLQISSTFDVDMASDSSNAKAVKEAQAFIKSKRDEAEAFISALVNRSQSLLAVTEAIVKRQVAFFTTGDQSRLRPMVLKDISADTGLDMSAISRTTAGKYLSTPTGLYPLKMFFNEAPTEDSDTSSHEMLSAMQEIIEAESPQRPLSDQAIQDEMEKRGYSLARRTVTKYREKLGYPVARLRKKLLI